MKSFIAYYRVSTQRQGASRLGLEAQQEAVSKYVKGVGEVLEEFEETETGKGSNALKKRPQLRAALEACKKRKAVLVIAKLDRLARNVHFLSGLLESKVPLVACDMPEANEVTLQMMAVFAEYEAKCISKRTKEALAAAKRGGKKLGTAGWENLRPNVEERQQKANEFAANLKGQVDGFRLRSLSQRQMVAELNTVGITAPRGGNWSLIQLQRTIARLKFADYGQAR